MLWFHLIVILTLYFFYAAFERSGHHVSRPTGSVMFLFGAAFFLRLIFAYLFGGNAEMPGSLFTILAAASPQNVQAKLPCILCDLIIAWLFWRTARKKLHANRAFWLTCVYLFNPALIMSLVYEKYSLYPLLFLLLYFYVYSNDSRFFDCYTAFTVCCFYKTVYVFYIQKNLSEGYQKAYITIITILTVAAALYFCRILLTPGGSSSEAPIPLPSDRKIPFGIRDLFLVAGICAVYGGVAFWNLGIMQTPVTEYSLASGESIVLDFGEDPKAQTLSWYLKDSSRNIISLETRDTQSEPWQNIQEINMNRVFCWESCTLESSGRYFRLTNLTADTTIAELVIQDQNGTVVSPVNAASMETLFDETGLFPQVIDYQSGSYFDETYYTRTAYEFLNGTRAYENTHPPLGKILISIGVMCFGTSPFGFRFMGTLFGILMLPFVYLLGRDLAKSRMMGAFACFLFAFDFMHFTQTRIATIDVFITFFTIMMYYFMYQYSRMSFYDTPLIQTFLPLGACGIAFGLGISCKWTGFYAGVGLAVVFFLILYRRYREYVYAAKDPEGNSNGISHAYIILHFREFTAKTILFCVLFFAAVPFLIYLLSYLPFSDGTDAGLFVRMWNNQKFMLQYHTGLTADHAYASSWYQWPLMIRPVFYYSRIIDGTMRQGISAFGNPLVWWAGIPAFFYMVYLCLKKKEKNAGFLCIAYLSCYLPWCFVTRCTFAYHYFPSVPFIACMIMYSFAQWKRHIGAKKCAVLVIAYSALALLLFVLFYPVISGRPVSKDYVANVLRWLDTWALVQ